MSDLPSRVILDYAQEVHAAEVALARILSVRATPVMASRYNKAVNFHEMVAECAESVGAEIAVAQYFGVKNFRATYDTFKNQADVMERLEVKWTFHTSGHLIIYPNDRATDVAMLVTGRSPVYQIVGWIPVALAKTPEFKHESQNTYWVPQASLYDPEILRSRVNGHN